MQQTNSIGNITFVSLYSPEQAKVVIASELFTVTTHRKFKMPGICCADGCDNSRQRKPRYTIDTIVNNCGVLLELNSPEQAIVLLITSELFSPLGFGYNSLAHIDTLACSGTFSFDKTQQLFTIVSINHHQNNTVDNRCLNYCFRRQKANPQPLIINGEEVERTSCFKFLGVMLSEDLKWVMNTTATVKKAQQRLYFLRILKRNNLSSELLKSFYHCCIESVLTYCITAWYVNCTDKDRKSLSQVIRSAE